jgi:hypothetical protein
MQKGDSRVSQHPRIADAYFALQMNREHPWLTLIATYALWKIPARQRMTVQHYPFRTQ